MDQEEQTISGPEFEPDRIPGDRNDGPPTEDHAPAPPPLAPAAHGPGWRDLMAALAIIWAAELVLGIVVAVVSIGRNGLPMGSDGIDLVPWAVVAVTPVSAAVTIGACWYYACRRYNRGFADGLYLIRTRGSVLKASAIAGFVCALVGGGLMAQFSTGESAIAELVAQPAADDPDKIELFYPLLAVFVLVPILEEIYYRGFIFSVLERLLGGKWALGIVTVWFGLVHAPQLAGDLFGLPVVAGMGALFTWLRYRFGSIVPSILCHFAYNATLVGMSVVQVTLENG